MTNNRILIESYHELKDGDKVIGVIQEDGRELEGVIKEEICHIFKKLDKFVYYKCDFGACSYLTDALANTTCKIYKIENQ